MVGTQLEGDLYTSLMDFAATNTGGNVSAAVRELIRTALFARAGQLGALSGRNLKASGYNEGVRQGLHEVKVAISGVVKGMWK